MDEDKGAELSRLAAELLYLREAAKIAGEPFLVHLIAMAALEAERLMAEIEMREQGREDDHRADKPSR